MNLLNQISPKPPSILFDKIYNGKAGVLPPSKFVYLIEKRGKGFYSEYLVGHLRKVYPNESGSLDYFDFVRCYMDKEVSMESTEEAERLVVWGYKVSLMDIQRAIFVKVH